MGELRSVFRGCLWWRAAVAVILAAGAGASQELLAALTDRPGGRSLRRLGRSIINATSTRSSRPIVWPAITPISARAACRSAPIRGS